MTPLPCPNGYDAHADGEVGFSACYPSGWQASKYEDPETEAAGVDFASPIQNSEPIAKRISVRAAPVSTDASEEELLEGFVMDLMNRRARGGREVVPIRAIVVDGRRAAEDTQETTVFSGTEQVKVSGWVAGFPAQGQMWYITVSGYSESLAEVEGIYREFLSRFHLVPGP
jgi:hypothetical protein